MKVADIRNIQKLMEWIDENDLTGSESSLRRQAEWFLACLQARILYDCTVKDNASLFLNGITPIKDNHKEANSIIMSYWEDSDYDNDTFALEDAVTNFTADLSYHFGVPLEVIS